MDVDDGDGCVSNGYDADELVVVMLMMERNVMMSADHLYFASQTVPCRTCACLCGTPAAGTSYFNIRCTFSNILLMHEVPLLAFVHPGVDVQGFKSQGVPRWRRAQPLRSHCAGRCSARCQMVLHVNCLLGLGLLFGPLAVADCLPGD